MVTSSANWPSIVQRDLSLVFLDQLHGFPSMLPRLYRFMKATQGTEYDLLTTGFGLPKVFTDSIYYDQPQEGYKKFVQETQYALGFIVTRQLLRNDLYGVIRNRASDLANSFRLLRETAGAFPFVNAANAAFTVGDGNPLAYASHTSPVSAITQSNTNSLAFSAPNLQANRLQMKKWLDDRGIPQTNIPDLILAPMDLEETVYQVLKSMGQLDTANNNRNYSEGRYDAVIWDNFLTSSSNWGLINSKLMKERLVFREWEPTSFMRSGEFDTLSTKFAGYTSFGISTPEWRWVNWSAA